MAVGGGACDAPAPGPPGAGVKRPQEDAAETQLPVTVVEAEGMCERIQAKLAGLEGVVKERLGVWKARLAEVQKAVAPNDAKLSELSAALARERYGGLAAHFSPEPPQITALVGLSARSEEEMEFTTRVEELLALGGGYKKLVLQGLEAAKGAMRQGGGGPADTKVDTGGGDVNAARDTVRQLGRCLNTVTGVMRSAQRLDRVVGNRISTANKRLFAYRSARSVREVDPSVLCDVPPSADGYRKVLDFYRLSSSILYSFGRQFEGPQHFIDIKRNVGILSVWRLPAGDAAPPQNGDATGAPPRGDDTEVLVYNNHAVSGEDAVGAPNPPARDTPVFDSCACEDGLGEVYNRAFDAEYKLITEFIIQHYDAAARYRAVLWSKKPLCESCGDVLLRQVPARYANVRLTVLIDDEEEGVVAGEPQLAPGATGA